MLGIEVDRGIRSPWGTLPCSLIRSRATEKRIGSRASYAGPHGGWGPRRHTLLRDDTGTFAAGDLPAKRRIGNIQSRRCVRQRVDEIVVPRRTPSDRSELCAFEGPLSNMEGHARHRAWGTAGGVGYGQGWPGLGNLGQLTACGFRARRYRLPIARRIVRRLGVERSCRWHQSGRAFPRSPCPGGPWGMPLGHIADIASCAVSRSGAAGASVLIEGCRPATQVVFFAPNGWLVGQS